MPLTVADSLASDDVLIDLSASSKKDLLETLSETLADRSEALSSGQVFDALIERERLGCTAAEFGLAIPHARLANATAPIGLFARLEHPIDFDGQDVPHVDLLFCFVLPEYTSDSYNDAMQKLAVALMTEPTCDALRNASTPEDVLTILRECSEHAAGIDS
ncbi:MAG: PTS sugar transporter subunit IIA [Woeseiaceae bacterium]